MKTTGKLFVATAFSGCLANIAQAHPGHDGHELTWSFHHHGLWDSPITFIIGVLITAAVVFRFAEKQK